MAKSKTEIAAENAAALCGALDAIEQPAKVVGLDLSYREPGFAVVYANGESQSEHIDLKRVDGDDALVAAASKALELTLGGNVRADLIVVESPFSSLDNGSKIWLPHGAVRAFLRAAKWYGPIVQVSTGQLKQFAAIDGVTGAATKAAMVAAAREQFGLTNYNDNQADARIAAFIGWALLGRPQAPLTVPAKALVARMRTGKALTKAQLRELEQVAA